MLRRVLVNIAALIAGLIVGAAFVVGFV